MELVTARIRESLHSNADIGERWKLYEAFGKDPYQAPDANQFTSEPTHNLKTIFVMAQRVTIRKRTPYNTKSNRRRVVKTPGGKLVYQHLKKLATAPKCGDCGVALPGVPALRPRQYATISKRQKTVRRAYGGSRCGDCVKQRILRAFLIEEAKIVKKVIKSQEKGGPRK
ncbi:60S ribosomal protein L34-A OS=Saccharomyces cerevisiae (strain ATCC 204508 / S288c) GN=RPL34A PE=1 SV=1 [Rhizoctonia solani AG-1 IB]|uniref:60S ribosomal protein L34-B n=2 Tax=Rhizoctonia solani TaxID=456999 RepID=A0A8H3BFX4_9AGAM|nr:unnamed protein product [Rhizoctonia solani]CEL53255.1 60S ribosomal protein L34-A OS=Saccharomyces cerevisiae (strain ATCC 204508 / S288c) GN=RPL34A PE=1 SV=1 [Rhizoctonia solani AG-1 IB]